jgi:uncharacterized protein (DUF983 family)
VNVLFACPTCEAPARTTLDRPSDWQCPQCDHRQHFEKADPALPACAVCGNHELYKQKDFPHRFGLILLILAFAASIYTYGWYEKWLTYAILIGTALFDGALYLWVGDALVCYRCGSYHKGFKLGAERLPFEITIGERYRQERMRKDRLKAKADEAKR